MRAAGGEERGETRGGITRQQRTRLRRGDTSQELVIRALQEHHASGRLRELARIRIEQGTSAKRDDLPRNGGDARQFRLLQRAADVRRPGTHP